MGRLLLSRTRWAGAAGACVAAGLAVDVYGSAAGLGEPLETGSRSVSAVLVGMGVLVMVAYFVLSLVRRDKAPPGYKLPPVYSAPLPVVGNFLGFASDPLGFVAQARAKCGSVFTIDMLVEKCTFLIGAEAHVAFFEATDEELDQAPVYKFMTPIFGKGIVYDCPISKRRQQMRALGSCLRPSYLKKYAPIIAQETREYLDKHVGEEGTIDLHKTFAELIINTASATLLGPEIRGEMFEEMSELYEMLDKGLTPLSIFWPSAPTAAHANRDEARVGISELFAKVLARRRADPESASKQSDIIKKLMEFTYSDGTKFTDDEIAGMILAALFAGQHTSSIVTTWSMLHLLKDRQDQGGRWYDAVVDELAQLEPEPGTFARGEGLDAATVGREEEMYKVIKEAIRLHPPIIMLMRRVTKPITMKDGTYIPVGHRAMVSNAIAQRLPEVFTDPDTFDPSRWDEFNIAKLPKYSFIGFGAGLHTCMGEPFAFMQVRTIMSVMLAAYDMELLTPFPEADYTAMVVPPKGPNKVRLKRRTAPLSRLPGSLQKDAAAATAAAAAGTPAEPEAAQPEAVGDDDDEGKTQFTRAEVAKHNTKESLWIIVKDKVYDVTNYLDVHQGGDAAIINWGGKDATEAVAGPQHPSTVPQLLNRYEIGTLSD